MVAAVVIPIIFIYFFIITIKDRKRKYEEYLLLNHIKEEALLTGVIFQVDTKKKAYVGKHMVYVTTLVLQDERLKRIKATRISAETLPIPLLEGNKISCYGYWDQTDFRFNRYQIEQKDPMPRNESSKL